MTTKELIKQLEKLDPDKQITIEGCDCEAEAFDVDERTFDILIGRKYGVNKPQT